MLDPYGLQKGSTTNQNLIANIKCLFSKVLMPEYDLKKKKIQCNSEDAKSIISKREPHPATI